MAKPVQIFTLTATLLLLTACGLHLRGHGINDAKFAFHSIYIQSPGETQFTKALRRGLESYKVEVSQAPEKSDLTLEIVYETKEKQITALNSSGHVIEYQLRYRISLRAYDRQQNEWLPATEIQQKRIFPYDDTLVLAKSQEEEMLYDDMRMDMAQQVLRRLNFARPPQPANP
jgi:LPS-assembly lipoprotein